MFRSEIGSGLEDPGGTPPPRIPRSTPPPPPPPGGHRHLRSIVMVLSPSNFDRKGLGHFREIWLLNGGPLLIGRRLHQKQHSALCYPTFRMRVRSRHLVLRGHWKNRTDLRTGLQTLWTIRIGPQIRQLVCIWSNWLSRPQLILASLTTSRWDWILVHYTHWPRRLKNHTFWDSTYQYSPRKRVVPPQMLSALHICDL